MMDVSIAATTNSTNFTNADISIRGIRGLFVLEAACGFCPAAPVSHVVDSRSGYIHNGCAAVGGQNYAGHKR
jgi:hypothetical protein